MGIKLKLRGAEVKEDQPSKFCWKNDPVVVENKQTDEWTDVTTHNKAHTTVFICICANTQKA